MKEFCELIIGKRSTKDRNKSPAFSGKATRNVQVKLSIIQSTVISCSSREIQWKRLESYCVFFRTRDSASCVSMVRLCRSCVLEVPSALVRTAQTR
jgi:hypothetical protein